MARIKNVDLPDNKRIEVALTYIHGIGRKLSRQILTKLDINLDTKAKDLTTDEITDSYFYYVSFDGSSSAWPKFCMAVILAPTEHCFCSSDSVKDINFRSKSFGNAEDISGDDRC